MRSSQQYGFAMLLTALVVVLIARVEDCRGVVNRYITKFVEVQLRFLARGSEVDRKVIFWRLRWLVVNALVRSEVGF